MEILSIRPPSPRDGKDTVAIFDAQLTPSIRMYNLRLFKGPAGRLLTYAPQQGKRRVATFTPELSEQLTVAAQAAMTAGHADAEVQ